MIELGRDNAVSARGMLLGKFSNPLGKVVKRVIHTHYYMVDGKVWAWDDDGKISRCDDLDEREELLAMIRKEAVQ